MKSEDTAPMEHTINLLKLYVVFGQRLGKFGKEFGKLYNFPDESVKEVALWYLTDGMKTYENSYSLRCARGHAEKVFAEIKPKKDRLFLECHTPGYSTGQFRGTPFLDAKKILENEFGFSFDNDELPIYGDGGGGHVVSYRIDPNTAENKAAIAKLEQVVLSEQDAAISKLVSDTSEKIKGTLEEMHQDIKMYKNGTPLNEAQTEEIAAMCKHLESLVKPNNKEISGAVLDGKAKPVSKEKN